MTDKERRKRFGLSGKPLSATRVLVKPMNSGDFNNQKAQCLLVIDQKAGTITPVNTYNGNAGKNFVAQPRLLPGEDRMKEYAARGYMEGNIADHPVLVDVTKAKTVTAKV